MGTSHPDAAIAVPPTLFISDAEVAQLTDWPSAVQALRQAYASAIDPAMVPPRSMARGDGRWLRGLTAVSPIGGHMGCKLISASTRHRRASYLISLFDGATMGLAALIDGNRVTGIRTAATATVAVDKAAPLQPLQVAVIGSGFEARGLLLALAAIREIAGVQVFSPTPASRERFANDMRTQEGLRGEWLEPGMTVVSIGSTLPEQREVDEEVLARAGLIVADMVDEVAHDTGDLIAAGKAQVDVSAKLVSLADFVAGRAQRERASDIVVYKSVGSALQDVITAEMLLARAREKGLGTPLAHSIVPVSK